MASRARHAVREDSWDSLRHSEISNESTKDEEIGEEEQYEAGYPGLRTVGDVHRAIHPLQATADRVGKQVEKFAENLDRLCNRRQRHGEKESGFVLPLVQEYEKIAGDTVRRLKKQHEPERQEKLKKSWKRRMRGSSGRSTPISIHEDEDNHEQIQTTVEDLQNWEQERQTWRLLSLMLQIELPIQDFDHSIEPEQRLLRPNKDAEIHPFCSEQVIWNHFLAENDDAWERHVVVEWLKTTAESSGQDIDVVVEQLEMGADRGTKLWAHGWLYSKEAIKGQKRLRSWPQPLEPDSPGIETSLVNAQRTQGLVTQLDPDAVTRQKRSLEKEDLSFERATWLACWEMVRRGRSWQSIREWCKDRVEGWRALSMRGDPRDDYGDITGTGTGTSASYQSRSLWRNMCAKAAQRGGIDDYENAVYGVLSGDLPSVEKIVRGWDDYMFAHYNSYLIRGFDFYLHNRFPGRVPPSLRDAHFPAEPEFMSGTEIVEKLWHLDTFKREARQPMKMLQGSLIGKRFEEFTNKQGLRLAQSANANQQSKIMQVIEKDVLATSVTAEITLNDYDLLRILTHMIFVFHDLEPSMAQTYGQENIIVAYIDYLGKAGKQQLLPLYASRLSPARAIECMARQLPFITDSGDRRTVMALMKEYNMDVVSILHTQLVMIILDTPPDVIHTGGFPHPRFLERVANHNGTRPLKKDFIGYVATQDQQDLIHGMEWYLFLDGYWEDTMKAGTMIYLHLLRTGGLAAARELARRVSFSDISRNKTLTLLGRAMDLAASQPSSEDEYEDVENLRRSTRSRSTQSRKRRRSSSMRKQQMKRDLLLSRADTFRDLENLVIALDTLETLREIQGEEPQHNDQSRTREWKMRLQRAQDAVVSAMEPLLQGWLQKPRDDEEAREFHAIRVAYLPEVTLMYNSVLHYGGHNLSRENLLKCLDLAAIIAEEGSDLAECFIAAGRMSELVDSMAVVSKSVLNAQEQASKPSKGKKLEGRTLSIWNPRTESL